MTRRIRPFLIQSIPHLVAGGLILVCIQLAFWQQERAAEKASLLSQWETAPILETPSPTELAQAPLFAEVRLTGHWEPTRHILLDNQTRQNHPGVHVFVPFRLAESQMIYMVNRGWQPWYRVTDEWPEYDTPEGEQTIQGRLSAPPRVGLQIGEASPLDPNEWPNLMTYFDTHRIQAVFGPDVAERVILLEPTELAHLSGDPWPSVNMVPDRHLAYAFQWFAIALAILVIWIALTYRFYRKHHE